MGHKKTNTIYILACDLVYSYTERKCHGIKLWRDSEEVDIMTPGSKIAIFGDMTREWASKSIFLSPRVRFVPCPRVEPI